MTPRLSRSIRRASGFTKPVGLVFEDSNNLLVTDETLNALFRIKGDFCSL